MSAWSSPDTVENITIGKDSDVEVGGENCVKPTDFLVPEESVRHPDLAGVGHRQILDLPWNTGDRSETQRKRFSHLLERQVQATSL